MNKIEIKCETDSSLRLEELMSFQGYLKVLAPKQFRKLRDSITENGFIAPVFVWVFGEEKYILDGHQRVKVLEKMKKEGCEIPELPVVFIDAESRDDARRKLLAITSQYGKFNTEELTSWLEDNQVGYFSNPDIDIKMSYDGEEQGAKEDAYIPKDDSLSERVRGNILNGTGKSIILCPYCGTEQEYKEGETE